MKITDLIAMHRLYGLMKRVSRLESFDIRTLIWLSTQQLPQGLTAIRKGLFYKEDPTLPTKMPGILKKLKERGFVAEYENYPHNIFSCTKKGRDMVIQFKACLRQLENEGLFEYEEVNDSSR